MTKIRTLQSPQEADNRKKLSELYKNSPVFENEKVAQAGLFQRRQELSKLLFFNELYRDIAKIHGVIMEFGVRWGQNLITLSNLRGIYEPYNYNRKIIGFDTFEGFRQLDSKDGKADYITEGAFNVSDKYENFLGELLKCHQAESPLNHIEKFEICKGNAPELLREYLQRNPQTIIAFAYFDFDIFQPTLECLQLIKPHLVKGSIIGFDELNDPGFPGETVALQEAFGLNNICLQRSRFSAMQSFFVVQ